MSADNGCVDDLQCSGLFDTGTTNQTLGDEFVKYIKVAKNCGNATGQGCWATNIDDYYDGTLGSHRNFDADTRYKFVTIDGISIMIINAANNCGSDWSLGELRYMSQTCGIIFFDVNGIKEPNNFGRDIFEFYITNGHGALLYPAGGSNDNYQNVNHWWNNPNLKRCSDNSDKAGWNCTGRIMEQGWVMDY